jgi:hypothetical protein
VHASSTLVQRRQHVILANERVKTVEHARELNQQTWAGSEADLGRFLRKNASCTPQE